MAKMACPICGQNFDEQHVQFLENGNPACPACVEKESSKDNVQNNTKKNSNPPKKICKKCKTEFDANQDFCPHCGRKHIAFVPFLCSNCQHEIASKTKFCPFCGKKAISSLEKEKRKKRLKKAGIISLVALGILLVGLIIFLNIQSKQSIARAERFIDEIGHDYSDLHQGNSSLAVDISHAECYYDSLSEREKAKVSNYSHLEEALIEYNARLNAIERMDKLMQASKPRAENIARHRTKNPSTFRLNISGISWDYIYEYNGNCYFYVYVNFSANNSFGGLVDDYVNVYFKFNGNYADIPTTEDIDLNQCSEFDYYAAQKTGKCVDPYEW